MNYVIGTAGHIDHGKTTLVKALTGQDTDRLKEEKERGISIDLGFAYLDLPKGGRVGIVDVPGHERFIRNMLAGAHGIDLVLFVVAADDGVMPQTEEHLDIVHLLGVSRAIFAITKADLVASSRLLEVEDEIGLLVAGTAFERSPIVHVSSTTGQGIEELLGHIVQIVRSDAARRTESYFRLPVDRVFVLPGHGLIVTGTALSGEVRVGDRVRCLPGGQIFRVRSLQVHNEAFAVGQWGQRVALNLAGQDAPIERGHVVCHEALTMTSDRFDAFVEVRPSAARGIRSHQRVRVHLGTAERLGTLIVLGADKMGPRESAYCQLVLSEPLLTMRGDHFVIRDETARRTIGGGVVIDPWSARHRKSDRGLMEKLDVLRRGELGDVLRVFLDESAAFAVPIGPIHQFANLTEDAVLAELQRVDGVRAFALEGETLYSTERKWTGLTRALLNALEQFHAAHPLAPGMEMEAARDTLPGSVPPRLFRAVIGQLESENRVLREGNLLRLPSHSVRLKDDERGLADRITSLLARTPLAPPDLKQLQAGSGVARDKLEEVLRVMERTQSVVRVSPELYFLRGAVDDAKAILRQQLSESSDVTPAIVRDLFGTSRKYAVPLLEFLDREGVTMRVGTGRRLRR